jgi:hypothetical protein
MTTPKSRANAGKAGETAPLRPSTRVRCKLASVDDVKLELARLYREGKAGTRDVADASRLANILALLVRAIEIADFERRIALLEALKDTKGEPSSSRRH